MSEAAQHLAKLIELEGPIPISTFMQIALAHPKHGYYPAHAAIGVDGDFITAPEVSQLFGELVGVWVLQSWLDLEQPLDWQLIELGPGRGTLMSDILRTLKLRPWSLDGVQLHLVETSKPLRATQRETLGPMAMGALWHENIDSIPSGPAILVANEFFDALPIRQFIKLKGIWNERRVTLDETSSERDPPFRFVAEPTLFDVEHEVPLARTAANGEVVELSSQSRSIAATIGKRLASERGRALIIDYGYAQERHGDTLQALSKHTKLDPLERIGQTDVTAHVDFASIGVAAEHEGARAYGPITQREFLSALGIRARLAALSKAASPAQRQRLERGAERLTSPGEMGDLFRVLVLSSPQLPAPPAFEGAR